MLFNLILCPIDFSEFSIRAYQHALSLAAHYGAKLIALHVVELWRYPYADYAATAGDYANFRRALHEGGKAQLRDFVRTHPHDEVQPELIVYEGRAPDSILSFAQEQKMELIVMGTHGRRGFDRLMLGSVTDRVMRTACCPVLAVCCPLRESVSSGEKGRRVHHLSRILFCTDFSENSKRALSYAVSVAEEYASELTLMHVLEQLPRTSTTGELIATATKQLDKLVPAESRKTLKLGTIVQVGKPYQRIIEHAKEEQMELVVMGVRGAGAWDRAVFGSTTYRVLQLGPCPVLAVHA